MSLVPPEPSLLAPGFRLDRYELLCPIAEGGMAQVWIARLRGKHGFEKVCAIKTILPKFASDLRFQNMFLDEARIASGIEHTNVAHILDLGEEHSVLYLAMEYVDGDALAKLHRAVEKKKELIPPGILLRVIADTCGGLHAAHELRGKNGEPLGVVHRDVSPQNILVSTNGVAKLIDFGIAKARDRLAGDTNTGSLKGKVQYMAPEQALGSSTDRRADLWALGAILYHYLSGNPPFEGPNQLATLHRLTSGQPPLPLPPSVPAPIVAVVKRALAHKPAERYATAAEMQSGIEAALVESGHTTTTAQVAAYLEQEIPDRAQRRREAIELALAAAAERARMQQLLRPPSADSSNGVADLSPVIAEKVLSSYASGASIASEPPPPTAAGIPPMPLSAEIKIPPPPSVPTSAAATLDAPAVTAARGRTLPLVIGGVGVVGIVLGVVATLALRAGDAPNVASRPPVSVDAPPRAAATATATATASAEPAIASATRPAETASADPAPATSETATARTARPSGASPARTTKPATGTTPRTIPKVIDNGF